MALLKIHTGDPVNYRHYYQASDNNGGNTFYRSMKTNLAVQA
jgi:hypothetical protein